LELRLNLHWRSNLCMLRFLLLVEIDNKKVMTTWPLKQLLYFENIFFILCSASI
jgi:hypothetical protein